MSLKKRDKALLAVFLVGLVALVADRTILRPQGGPGAASAAGPGGTGLMATNVPIFQEQPPVEGVAERLNKLGTDTEPDFEQLRNPFALPASWFRTPDAAGQQVPDAVADFMRTHRLTAVVVNGASSYAVFDDRFLVPGQAIDGFTLVSIGDRSALFESEGRQVVLELLAP